MRKRYAVALVLCLLLAGCGKGAQPTPTATASAQPTLTASAEATETIPQPTLTAPELPPTGTAEAALSILFINVGYGDAILIQTGGKNYLVDTGAKDAFISLYRALSVLEVDELDGLFLTHTHSDHVGGAQVLAQRCDIGTLYSAEISMDKDNGEYGIDELAGDLGLTHMKLSAGDTVDIGSGAYFEILGPLVYNGDNDNDNSLVMKLHAAGISVLLTGDMQFAEEQTLLNAGVDLTADVLKVGNHGNPDATSDAFAQAAGSSLAVISTSTAQDDDTPNERVLAVLGGARIEVTQDYACGVRLTVSGGAYELFDPQIPGVSADIVIQEIDTEAQTITIVNNGGDADISGYFILSEKGSEVFVFPVGAALAAGEKLTVACTGGSGAYIWDDKKVWSDKGDEAGVLFDAYGNMLSRMQ